MHHRYSILKLISAALLAGSAFFFFSCNGPDFPTYNGGVDDPFPLDSDPPELVEILPEAGFPGDEAFISGSGFKQNEEQNLINIGSGVAEIVEINSDGIRVRVPQNENGQQQVRATVWGSDLWSNELYYKYLDDFAEMGLEMMNPGGVAVDDEGSLYASSIDDEAVYRIDVQDSVRTVYASFTVSGPMEFGPGGYLYSVGSEGLMRIPPGGGSNEVVVEISNLTDFDWDSNGDIYLMHANTLSRYSNGQLDQGLRSVTQGSRMRIFNGHLYVTELTRSRVSRFEITPDGLGELEIYASMGTPLSGLDVDANGNVYAAGFIREYVFKIAPDREDDSDVEQIPNEADQANPFRSIDDRVADIYLHNTVMYLVQNRGQAGQIGQIWRIFIDEPAAPKVGRE